MQLLLIRHAIAQEREEFARTGHDDEERPLTDDGRRKMKRGARGLRVLVPEIALLATSRLARSAQTGAILDSAYGGLSVVEIEELAPGAPLDRLVRWLARQSSSGSKIDRGNPIALVGHEPDLGALLALLVGASRPFHRFRKGGAAMVSFAGKIEAGTGDLIWAFPPACLRELGEG
ncbi:MAG TPA: histidine phosphatase family protein [Thermoanaerobaculia bacterium]|nr:histidine phosphatase family protein [Thermoanaerobaculia bacterium]